MPTIREKITEISGSPVSTTIRAALNSATQGGQNIVIGETLISEISEELQTELNNTNNFTATIETGLIASLNIEELTTELNENLEAQL